MVSLLDNIISQTRNSKRVCSTGSSVSIQLQTTLNTQLRTLWFWITSQNYSISNRIWISLMKLINIIIRILISFNHNNIDPRNLYISNNLLRPKEVRLRQQGCRELIRDLTIIRDLILIWGLTLEWDQILV